MQLFFICFVLIALLFIIEGWRRTVRTRPAGTQHYCSVCGWTSEQVQDCEFEVGCSTMIAPLCFDCTIKREAVPVRSVEDDVYSKASA